MIKANPSPNENGFAFNLSGDAKDNRTEFCQAKFKLNRVHLAHKKPPHPFYGCGGFLVRGVHGST